MDELGVTITGQPFDHRLYHFSLALAGLSCLGRESFVALAEVVYGAQPVVEGQGEVEDRF
jgi:hypothetical protein